MVGIKSRGGDSGEAVGLKEQDLAAGWPRRRASKKGAWRTRFPV